MGAGEESFGRPIAARLIGRYELSLRQYDDLARIPMHVHHEPYVTVVLEGGYREQAGPATRNCGAHNIIVHGLNLRDSLAATGLAGDELRGAFIAQAIRDKFESSIWAHEGRHAIDKTIFHISDSPELEFRAKLSEVALAPSPRMLGSILRPVGGTSAHGVANKKILEGVTEWMVNHAAEIHGFDSSHPALPQLDLLSDAQLRAAFRSLDPLATQSPETHSDATGLRYTVLSAHVESAPANDRHGRQPEGGRG